jgi:hypothetical protein
LKCPECENSMYWIVDQVDEEKISSEYQCVDCNIDLIKHEFQVSHCEKIKSNKEIKNGKIHN